MLRYKTLKMKKKLFAIHFSGNLGAAMQPIKANTAEEAKAKFMAKFTNIQEECISTDIEEIEPDNKNFRMFKSQAF